MRCPKIPRRRSNRPRPASRALPGRWYVDEDDWWVRPNANGTATWLGCSGSFTDRLDPRMKLWPTDQNPPIITETAFP